MAHKWYAEHTRTNNTTDTKDFMSHRNAKKGGHGVTLQSIGTEVT